jgi:hypothetical protein
MKKTAVEWLVEMLELESFANISTYSIACIEKAKEMERNQIIDAYQTSHISMMTAEQYYNETFKSKEQ